MEFPSQLLNYDVDPMLNDHPVTPYIDVPEELIKLSFECEQCGKFYKRKASLKRHVFTKHNENNIEKLKLENDHLQFKIKLYCQQIKFLKRLIIIQDHILREGVKLQKNPNTNTYYPKSTPEKALISE